MFICLYIHVHIVGLIMLVVTYYYYPNFLRLSYLCPWDFNVWKRLRDNTERPMPMKEEVISYISQRWRHALPHRATEKEQDWSGSKSRSERKA